MKSKENGLSLNEFIAASQGMSIEEYNAKQAAKSAESERQNKIAEIKHAIAGLQFDSQKDAGTLNDIITNHYRPNQDFDEYIAELTNKIANREKQIADLKKQLKTLEPKGETEPVIDKKIIATDGKKSSEKTIRKNNNTIGDFKQRLSALPVEILALPRFLPTRADNPKQPIYKAWQNPKNQKLYSELKGIIGFVAATDSEDSLLFVDFDHALDENGNFVNADAESWFYTFSKDGFYCEKSQSGRGLHFFAKPTKSKYEKVTGRIYLTDDKQSFIEIFYRSNRFCLVTGDTFCCKPNAPIAKGEEADRMMDSVIKALKKQAKSAKKDIATLGNDYDLWRTERMLDIINPADLSDSDWLAVMTACKNLGVSDSIVDAFNRRDPDRYNEAENQSRCDSVTDSSFGIETLHGIAKHFGYSEKDSQREWYSLHSVPKDGDTQTFNGNDYLEGTIYDSDNAKRLAKFGGNFFHWLEDDEIWITYADGIWKRRSEKHSCLYSFVEEFLGRFSPFAQKLTAEAKKKKETAVTTSADGKIKNADEQARKNYETAEKRAKIARNVEKVFMLDSRRNAAINSLKGLKSILTTADKLNKRKNLICVKNGVVDLKTGKFYKHDPRFLITNQINADYDPNVDTSFVEKFLAEILPDEETRRAVLRYVGYCLTGEKNYHISEFWRGSGANGKSTLIDLLIKLFGTYAVKLPNAALLESRKPVDGNSATPALSKLDGDIRLAIVDELPRNARLDASLYKTITGDEFVYARALYSNPRNIELRAKLIINGNHLPMFDVDDDGMLRRINNVEFRQKFKGDRADESLPKKLSAPENLSALLKILVDEAQAFYREGLIESEDMKTAKQEYIAESDFVASFIEEHCHVGDGGQILRKTFEEKLADAYPRECARLKKKELLDLIISRLEPLGAVYAKDNHNKNIFLNVVFSDPDKS